MQTELTPWVHLQMASSAIQLMKKNMQTELTAWMHLQMASSANQLMKKHADRTHILGAFAGALISHPACKK